MENNLSTTYSKTDKCRVCLENSAVMYSLFKRHNSATPYKKLMRSTKLIISPNDGGPSHICSMCLIELDVTVKFLIKCEKSNSKLQSLVCKSRLGNQPADQEDDRFNEVLIKQEDVEIEIDTAYVCNSPDYSCTNEIETEKFKQNNDDVLKICNTKIKRSKKLNMTALKEERPDKRNRKPKAVRYVCSVCKSEFSDKRAFREHRRTHLRVPGKLSCAECGREFTHAATLRAHRRQHAGDRPYPCDMCPKRFPKKDNLLVHRKRHMNKREYPCETCGAAHYTAYELRTHARTHTGEKPHACSVCGKRFTARNNLYIHARTHTGERPHECSECGKKFISNNILTIHKRIHTGEKPYVCAVCGKRFANNKLAAHMRTHTGEKPHVCSLCGSQFASPNVLAIHMRRHTGEKPYGCVTCGRRYGHTQSLNKHVRRHHSRPEVGVGGASGPSPQLSGIVGVVCDLAEPVTV